MPYLLSLKKKIFHIFRDESSLVQLLLFSESIDLYSLGATGLSRLGCRICLLFQSFRCRGEGVSLFQFLPSAVYKQNSISAVSDPEAVLKIRAVEYSEALAFVVDNVLVLFFICRSAV